MQGYNSPLSFHPEVKDLCQVAAPNHLQKQVPLPSLFFFCSVALSINRTFFSSLTAV